MTDIHALAAFHGTAENKAYPPEIRLSAALTVLDQGLEYFLGVLQDEVFEINDANGWFESDRSFGDDIALIHSEVSEALEAFRDAGFRRTLVCKACGETKDYDDSTVFGRKSPIPVLNIHAEDQAAESDRYAKAVEEWSKEDAFEVHCGQLMKPEGVASEFADILIRLVDCARRYPTLLARETKLKLAYNASRGYKHGGKSL